MNELKLVGKTEVCGIEIPHIEGGFGKGKKCMLAMVIAKLHNKSQNKVNERINENIKRFKIGIDIIDLKDSNFAIRLRDSGLFTQNALNAMKYLWLLSERGYAKLIKIFEDDLSWEKYDQILDEYFEFRNEHIEIKSESLSTVNEAAEILTNVIDEANLSPGIKALTLKTLYKEKANLLLPIEIKSEKQYFDTTQIAKRLGVMSKSGKPATTAISQLIKQLDISEDEKEAFFEGKGKWQGTVYKYADSVIKKVENWLKENNYPALIRGNSQNYHVQYALEVA
ncbi:hypothetical protein SH1V18_02770 [Vallitalea longa]|uniref:KilA-N DNA-binding domain-containing protein n=1 Tax=Vallitalea longa TaxID=2936439 RepID=A0A9W6DDY6_9FIRM|nr:ORF6N domain-containing protein [Vallitalea longa]GKX27797.1 hypothetical protein SH1V18_02770 [Vallitalea longa]